MTAAFVVKLDVDNISTLAETAADIEDDLTEKGYLVISVAPWRRHGLITTTPTQTVPPPPTL